MTVLTELGSLAPLVVELRLWDSGAVRKVESLELDLLGEGTRGRAMKAREGCGVLEGSMVTEAAVGRWVDETSSRSPSESW